MICTTDSGFCELVAINSRHMLKEVSMDLFGFQGSDLPPLISRSLVGKITGGLIAPRTMANLDSLGKGPRKRVRVGKKVAYPREAFVDWLLGRMEVDDV